MLNVKAKHTNDTRTEHYLEPWRWLVCVVVYSRVAGGGEHFNDQWERAMNINIEYGASPPLHTSLPRDLSTS